MKNSEEIQAELNIFKIFIARDMKTDAEQELAEETQALLSEAIEAAGSDDRDRLVSILDEIDTLRPERWDLTTVRQLLQSASEQMVPE